MKNNVYFDFIKSLVHTNQTKHDSFFSNETINKTKDYLHTNYDVIKRQISLEERRLITSEGFDLLLFWVNSGEITIDFFERFTTILVSFNKRIKQQIDVDSLPGMIEMMSLVEYKDHGIYTTIEIYINSPELLKRQFNTVH